MGKKNELEVAASGSVGADEQDPTNKLLLEEITGLKKDLDAKNSELKGSKALLDKRIAEVADLEKNVVELENALSAKQVGGTSLIVLNGVEYTIERHELLRDLIHLWRQQYVPDDSVVVVLKKKS